MYKILPKKLTPIELKAIIDVVKFWEESSRAMTGKLIRHNEWLNQKVLDLEQELRDYRQIKLNDQILNAGIKKPIVQRAMEQDNRFECRGHRFYEFLTTIPERSHSRMFRWDKVTVEEAKKEANEWAVKSGRPNV